MEIRIRRERRKPMAEMNVVPYIDVMLVLLVIFMITAPMLTQGLQVELPKAQAEPLAVKDSEPVIVSVKANGSYWLRQNGKDKRLPERELTRAVLALTEAHDDIPVLVNGDRRVPYGRIVTLMASLQQAGVRNVGLLTEAPPERR